MRHEHMLAWTPEEDLLILQLFAAEGRKWGRIAAMLPGRSSASVRNRYLRIEKGRQLRQEGKSKNRCAACGMHKLGHVCTVKKPEDAIPRTPPLVAIRVPESVPSPLNTSPLKQASAEDMGDSAPPLAASVVAILEPTSPEQIPPLHAGETACQQPNLVCAAADCAEDEHTRRGPVWMHGLQPLPILQRQPSSAAA